MAISAERLERGYTRGNSVELLRSGVSFFAAMELAIDSAAKYIHFQTYMVAEDETGGRIIDALVRAARRGVRVYLVLDAFGSNGFSKHAIAKVINAGILFRKFSPLLTSKGFQVRLRLHHKVLLVDGVTAIVGGINVANRYRGNDKSKEWLDFAIQVKGPICVPILNVLKGIWNKKFTAVKDRSRERIVTPPHFDNGVMLKVVQSNWFRHKVEILMSYRRALKHAQKNVIIVASYFLPGRKDRKIFRQASQRGIDISVVLPAESDVPMFKRATNFLYGFILRNNIKIYEYLPSNIHAKVATVDGAWSTIGSYNFNHLSDYGSIEMNLNILDSTFTTKFEALLHEIIKIDCREVTILDYKRRNTLLSRFADWFSYQFVRVMFRLMFYLTRKSE